MPPQRPHTVTLAATLIGLLALARFGLGPIARLLSGSPPVSLVAGELIILSFWLSVVWGLLAQQRWAWWISVVASAALGLAGLAAVALRAEILEHTPRVNPDQVVVAGGIVGLLAGGAALLLLLPSSRRAFRGNVG